MTKDEIILAQQARIKQLKESALRILRNKRGNDDWLILTIDCVGLEETLSIPDDLSALRAHDAKLLAPYQWQPIETAPKDGREVILWFPHKSIAINGHYGEVSDGDWESGYRTWMEWLVADELWFQEDPSQAPTHWMPLPSTEAIEKGGE